MFGKKSFRGGIHPPLEKDRTAHKPIERLSAPPYVTIHLVQQAGAAARPVVKQGDHVRVGQIIGELSGPLCASVHASVAGKVTEVGLFPHPTGKQGPAIKIENDGSSDSIRMPALEKPWREAALGELIHIIADAGIVGMGGGALPTHIKLSPPANKPIDTLIINGIESEPYLTADLRLMVEHPEDILTGALIVKKILGTTTNMVAIEADGQKAGVKISGVLRDPKFKDFSLAKLQSKYPQGSEKQLIQALLKKQIPSGGSSMDCACMVVNVATAYAIAGAVINGVPLYERVVTVNGPAIRSPKNLLAPIGTPLRHILDFCDIDMNSARKIVMGGAMTGIAQSDLEVSVQKTTCGILAFDRLVEGERRFECINCGNCVKSCPIRLVPSVLAKYVGSNKVEEALDRGIMDCIECGSCAYVCPSKINLVHFMKLGKYRIAGKKPAVVFFKEAV